MTDTNTLAPTDAEILDAADDFRSQYTHGGTTFDEFDEIGFARAVLAKWGAPALASPPAAVPASGPVGFDHKTAANFLNGKTVADEEMRRFVVCSRWAHDDRDGLRNTVSDLRREIAQRDAEIALLKISLLAAEQPAQALDARWVSAKDRLPDPFCEVLIHPRPTDYCCEGSVNTQGEWSYGEYEHHFGHNSIKCNVTHWMPLPTPPVAIAAQQGDAT